MTADPRLRLFRDLPAGAGLAAAALLCAPAPAQAAGLMPEMATLSGLAFALAGAGLLALYMDGRRWRHRASRQAEDAAALRQAYAELEAAKRQAEAQAVQTRATLAGMSDGLMVLDADMRLVQWNDRFAEISGVPPALLRIGTPMEALLRGQAEAGEFGPMATQAEVEAEVARRMAALRNFPVVGVAERVRPNGRTQELRRARLPDGGMISLYTDITERKRAEAAERAAHRAEQHSVAQQRRLVAMVSHEIRVPLEALVGSLALFDTAGLGDHRRTLIETAQRAGAALRALVTDILDLTRMENGQFVLRPENLDPGRLLAEVADLFRASAAARGITFVVEMAAAVPSPILADATRMRQVLMNLASNAAKYARPGRVLLRADLAQGQVRFCVVDSGPPIPASQAERLFLPFERLESAEIAGVTGTGLGLAISARLARLMGGRIGLEAEGGGNRFWFSVPLRMPPVLLGAVTLAEAHRRPTRRGFILLVEDVDANRNLTATLLRRAGHRVDVTASGLAAVRMAAAQPYDLILMDIHMPGIDGVEAASRIRDLPVPACAVPIVALTGATEIAAVGRRPGAVIASVLTKPVVPEELAATLRRILGPAAPPAEPAASRPARSGPLDHDRIAALREELDPAVFAELMDQCLDDIALRMPPLVAACAHGAMAEAEEGAHAIAGMAGGYGLAGVERRMRRMLKAIRDDDAPGLAALARGAEAELAHDGAAIRQLLAGPDAPAPAGEAVG